MTAHYIEHDGGQYHVYVHDGHGHRTRVGPRIGWDTPRAAAQYADLLDQRSPSPLRDSGEGIPESRSLPLPDLSAVPSPDAPRGRRRRRRAP